MFKLNSGSVQSRLVTTLGDEVPRINWTPEAATQALEAAKANVLGGFLFGAPERDGAICINGLHP